MKRACLLKKYQIFRSIKKNWSAGNLVTFKVWFFAIKSESSARNGLGCCGGGANCLLTTTPVSCAAQHHVGDGGHQCSAFLWLFDPVVYNENPREHWTLPHSNAACHQLKLLKDGKNSHMRMKAKCCLIQTRLIEIHQASTRKTRSDTFLTMKINPTRALNSTSLKYCLPSTGAIDRHEKIYVCVWRSKAVSSKRTPLKSIRWSQKKGRVLFW